MRFLKFGLALGLVMTGAVAAVGQVAQAAPQAGGQGPTIDRLQPDDVIRIQVYNQAQLQTDTPIGKDGYISAPFVGVVRAQGKTTQELADDLAVLFKKKLFLRDPMVSVTILTFRVLRATVGGSVQKPGTFPIRQGDTLVNLLNQGGGPITDVSDLRRATLRHADSREFIPIDLYALLNRGDLTQNYILQDGDELNVPTESNNRILVLGSVQGPGAYPYHEPMTLADAISVARGEVPTRARFSQVVITREKVGQPGQYIRIVANFTRFVRNGDQTQNIVLQPGDMVYVPETNTPDFERIAAVANSAYLINILGTNFFGLRL